MYAQQSAAAFGQDVEIAARLRRLDHAKAVSLSRHGEILSILAGDLQDHPAIGAALIDLSSRVQKARPETDASRGSELVADHSTQPLQRLDITRIAVDIREQRHVIAGAGPVEMRLEHAGEARRP